MTESPKETIFNQPVDVLVLGSGIAGCTAAIKAAERGARVVLVTRGASLSKSNTAWAQGGIVYEGIGDTEKLLVQDIFEAGGGIGYKPAIELLAHEGPERIREILLVEDHGERPVPFDRNSDGNLSLTEEGAHSVPRIIHVEDLTGKAIQDNLAHRVDAHPNITVLLETTAVDLLTLSHHGDQAQDRFSPPSCFGAYVLRRKDSDIVAIRARQTILATGGCGRLYLHTTNPKSARGDGLAMCWRAGVRLSHMEYIQFHPTSLYVESGPRFLITEAMRGEGARLIDSEGREFMKKYDERGTLAPRDVVSRAIHEELLASGHPCVYLDITHKPDDWIVERFPHIAKTCSQYGIDITSQPIPVVPAAHYSCGGVLVDADGATNMERLWAVGEVSCTGIHGANRLASTSLLEGLVWGARCGEKVVELLESSDASKERIPEIDPWQMAPDDPDPALITQDWNTIRYTMWNYVGLVRTRKRLNRARNLLRELETEIEDFYAYSIATDGLIGLRNGITAARAITMAALENRQTCGCHYRVD